MRTYAIIPARSGSKGIPNKNIFKVEGKELMAYSIEFAKKLQVDKVICSTDSSEYALIARRYGAEVPFLRSAFAATDIAMEHHILQDIYDKFDQYSIDYPDIFVWLRPTFVFRDIAAVRKCIELLMRNSNLSSCRVIVESESRLYCIEGGRLVPSFDDQGKSMIRRQDVQKGYKVFGTDVFRGVPKNCSEKFLGDNVGYVTAGKICGLDIDDEIDLMIVSSLISNHRDLVREYL